MPQKAAQPKTAIVIFLAIAMTCVISGLGLIAIYTQHVPARWTRFGHAGPLDGSSAIGFGYSIFFFGLMPLMLAVRTAKAALIIGSIAGTLGLLSIFAGIGLID